MINCKTLILFPIQIKAHFSQSREKERAIFWGQSKLDFNFYSYPWDLSDTDQILFSEAQSISISYQMEREITYPIGLLWRLKRDVTPEMVYTIIIHGKYITAIFIITKH